MQMKIHTPEEVGMSSERLARVDARMGALVKDNQILLLIQQKNSLAS